MTRQSAGRRTPYESNVHEDYEVRHWTEKFGCTAEELKAAVKKMGVMVKDVEKELKQ